MAFAPLGPQGPQEFFQRGPHPVQGVPQQMRRPMPGEMSKGLGGPSMGLPQHFSAHGVPVQQHSIMGQPFIELRHRAAENRPRMPFPPGAVPGTNVDLNMHVQRAPGLPAGPDSRFPLSQGLRMLEPVVSQVQRSGSMDSLHQQGHMPGNGELKQSPLMRSMSQPASNEGQNMSASVVLSAPPVGQMENVSVSSSEAVEKLDAEESAVKDLEDVEVKDLVDADLENLNLDPDDGKDLDLETNDLHLDDFLTSGKFDIIAYTDPDLDDIKKDMFNEELDLSDPIDENADTSDVGKTPGTGASASTSAFLLVPAEASRAHSSAEVKTEAPGSQDSASVASAPEIKTEVKDCQKASVVGEHPAPGTARTSAQQGALSDSTPVLSSLLIKQQPEEQSLKPIMEPVTQGSDLAPQQNPALEPQCAPGVVMAQTMPEATGSGEAAMTGFVADHQAALAPGVDQGGLTAALSQTMGQNSQHRPLLLEEQPLLLQDLLDQERQEQQQQRQMQAMIRQRSSDSFFPNIGESFMSTDEGWCRVSAEPVEALSHATWLSLADFDAITDPIMKAKMVALKGINKVMVQNNMGMAPIVMNR